MTTPREDAILRQYLDQLEPVEPVGYGDDPKGAFESGFGWAIDAVIDYLDGHPWTGPRPWMSHGKDGKPLPKWTPPRRAWVDLASPETAEALARALASHQAAVDVEHPNSEPHLCWPPCAAAILAAMREPGR